MALTTGETTVTLPNGLQRQVLFDTKSVTTTADAVTAFDALTWDVRCFQQVSITFIATTNAVTVGVWVANLSDFSDERLAMTAASVSVGTNRSWVSTAAALDSATNGFGNSFSYIRVKLNPTVGGSHGTMTATFFAKNT